MIRPVRIPPCYIEERVAEAQALALDTYLGPDAVCEEAVRRRRGAEKGDY